MFPTPHARRTRLLPQSLDRAVALARYHRPRQFLYRGLRMIQRRLPSASFDRSLDRLGPLAITHDAEGVLGSMAERRRQLWPSRHDAEWLEAMTRGEYRFLNRTGTLANQDAMPRLWRFHLQCQESLLELAEHLGPDHAWRMIADWFANPRHQRPGLDADAWHPFCISRRLPVWLMLAGRHGIPDSLRETFGTSAHRQAIWLARHLEWDLGGNHLLENLRTLAIAKFVLAPESDRSGVDDGRLLNVSTPELCRWIASEIEEQVLPSGEHYERAPTYHALMLLSLMEIRDVLPLVGAPSPDPSSQKTRRRADDESSPLPDQVSTQATVDAAQPKAQLSADADAPVPELMALLDGAIKRMQGFLQSILHPDGMIPLFGDSVVDETPSPAVLVQPAAAATHQQMNANNTSSTHQRVGTGSASLLPETDRSPLPSRPHSAAKQRNRTTAEPLQERAPSIPPEPRAARQRQFAKPTQTDYWIDRTEIGDCLIFDHGPLACDHLPAHGHADFLTFEASWRGSRLIVDRGTFDYEASEERQLCRATSGHNTLQADGADHADIWSRFRMGRRGRIIDVRRGSQGDFAWCLASHDAYRHLGVPRVARLILSHHAENQEEHAWVILDIAHANGTHAYRSPLHLSPEWTHSQLDGQCGWTCRPRGENGAEGRSPGEVAVMAIADDAQLAKQVRSEPSFYAPNFGERLGNVALVRRWTGDGLTWSGWLIGAVSATMLPDVSVSPSRVEVDWAGWKHAW